MAYPLAGMDSRKQGSKAEAFDESLSAELFNLLWGQDRSAIPTVVDYAYEEIWKRVPGAVSGQAHSLPRISTKSTIYGALWRC